MDWLDCLSAQYVDEYVGWIVCVYYVDKYIGWSVCMDGNMMIYRLGGLSVCVNTLINMQGGSQLCVIHGWIVLCTLCQ